MSIYDYLEDMTALNYDDLMGLDLYGYESMNDPSAMDIYAGGGYTDPGMDSMGGMGMMGMGSGGFATAGNQNSPQANPKGGLAGLLGKSLSPFAMPGTPQVAPDRDHTQKPSDPNQIGLRGRQGGVVRALNEPTGATRSAGNIVKNNYSNLNGLKNRAYGVNYG